jgi:DNA repair protein RecO (recombination protein O)
MRWSGQAIILGVTKFREHGGVVRLFSEDMGLFAGACRNVFSKKQRPIFEPGNIVQAEWSARLPEHLGNVRCELVQPMAAFYMQDAARLLALQSASSLTLKALAERDAHPALYHALWGLLQAMKFQGPWQEAYVRYELTLLQESGFGLELDQCAATGQREALHYVSPKSGRAVSAQAGEPYRDRLLSLPAFLREGASAQPLKGEEAPAEAILQGLALTGYFLEKRLFEPHQWKLPPMRARLLQQLQKARPQKQPASPAATLQDVSPLSPEMA